ncbi:MAG: endonuclease [Bacteroidales bacterium]|jgi:predicted extracellular nuclease|nr:endonuclease [Bacteroidales bacterium]
MRKLYFLAFLIAIVVDFCFAYSPMQNSVQNSVQNSEQNFGQHSGQRLALDSEQSSTQNLVQNSTQSLPQNSAQSPAQNSSPQNSMQSGSIANSGRIAFWNVENFFDCIDDTLKNDNEFTPFGTRAWGRKKYDAKCASLYKIIAALNAEQALIACGLSEIENARVLRDLCLGTPLRFLNFGFVHYDSPDPRGIDVALLYRKDLFRVLASRAVPLVYSGDNVSHTRDILYVKGITAPRYCRLDPQSPDTVYDTLHLFVCHFPSKFGGALETENKRYQAGRLLRFCIDTLLYAHPQAQIIAMGDFNGEPTEKPLQDGIGYGIDAPIVNLMLPFVGKKGSHKYHEKWSIIDHIIVTDNLKLRIIPADKAHIFDRPFLLMPDKNYMGQKVFRTFNGPKYLGGYSDHLPVYIDLQFYQSQQSINNKKTSTPTH